MISTLLRSIGTRPTVAPTFARGSLPATQCVARQVPQRVLHGPILMLGIGGVLHPGQSGTLTYLPLLETWLRTHPNVDAVIPSNWRETRTLDELHNFFSIELYERVTDCAPVLSGCTRLGRILYVVRKHGVIQRAAPNDRAQGFSDTRRLVATKYLDELTGGPLLQLTRVAWAVP